MSEIEYHSFPITVTKDFLIVTHSHPLISSVKEADDLIANAWSKNERQVSFPFGGKYGWQFKTLDEASDFESAFDDLLKRKNIAIQHKGPLLYLFHFFEDDIAQQAIHRNHLHMLRDYAEFMAALYLNGYHHVQSILKKGRYVELRDNDGDIFFAKAELEKSMPLEELIDYYPKDKANEDVIRFLTVRIGKHKLYISKDTIPAIVSSQTLKAIGGETIPHINVPDSFKYKLLSFTVETMMKAHKADKTPFYKLFNSDEMDIPALKSLFSKYKSHKFKNARALLRIGMIVSDYIKDNKLLKNKTAIASFLWEYFALFKAYDLEDSRLDTISYCTLTEFYLQKGITNESIRLLIRDAADFGDF